jgi:tRNA G37 N-methylase Trm5
MLRVLRNARIPILTFNNNIFKNRGDECKHMPIVTVVMFSDRIQTEKDRLAEAVPREIVLILNVERPRCKLSSAIRV